MSFAICRLLRKKEPMIRNRITGSDFDGTIL
jgi:hypothetical protein